jgi:hypothetical protein
MASNEKSCCRFICLSNMLLYYPRLSNWPVVYPTMQVLSTTSTLFLDSAIIFVFFYIIVIER